MSDMMKQETTVVSNQAALNSVAVMDQWGNGEVYNEDRWVERARQAARQAMEGMFELGRALIILKEHTDHGRFRDIAESELGLHTREVTRLMMATRRFATPQMQKAAPKLMNLGKSKLLELLVEEDEAVVDLADGGELNGHSLDDVERMSVRELRQALRDARDETDAARKVSAEKDTKINDLSEKLAKKQSSVKEAKPSDVADELKMSMGAIQVGIESQITRLIPVFEQMMAHAEANGMDHSPAMVVCLNQIIRDCESLREQFVLPQQPPVDAVPEWFKATE